MKHTCIYCGKEFTNSKKGTKFCSNECYHNHMREHGQTILKKTIPVEENPNYVLVKCGVCGKEEYVTKGRAKKYKTCSRECVGVYMRELHNKHITLECPICHEIYTVKPSAASHHKTCGKQECRSAWLSKINTGANNPKYRNVQELIRSKMHKDDTNRRTEDKYLHLHVVKEILGLKSITRLPKGYVIHHKNCNHFDNNPTNLIILTRSAHQMIHKTFGSILLSAIHTGKLSRELFYSLCTQEQIDFYKNIIDMDITQQIVIDDENEITNSQNKNESIYKYIYRDPLLEK